MSDGGASPSMMLAAQLHDAVVENTREMRALRADLARYFGGGLAARGGGLASILDKIAAEPGRLEGIVEQFTGNAPKRRTRR